jgi:hypothetical protein
MESMGFFIDKFFRPHCSLGFDLASNTNEYQERSLGTGIKEAGA